MKQWNSGGVIWQGKGKVYSRKGGTCSLCWQGRCEKRMERMGVPDIWVPVGDNKRGVEAGGGRVDFH